MNNVITNAYIQRTPLLFIVPIILGTYYLEFICTCDLMEIYKLSKTLFK